MDPVGLGQEREALRTDRAMRQRGECSGINPDVFAPTGECIRRRHRKRDALDHSKGRRQLPGPTQWCAAGRSIAGPALFPRSLRSLHDCRSSPLNTRERAVGTAENVSTHDSSEAPDGGQGRTVASPSGSGSIPRNPLSQGKTSVIVFTNFSNQAEQKLLTHSGTVWQ